MQACNFGILVGRTIAGAIGAAYGWRAVSGAEAAFMVPVRMAAALLLLKGAPSTNLFYGRLLALLWPLARDNRPIRASMIVQALLWACFNTFRVYPAALRAVCAGCRQLREVLPDSCVFEGRREK